MCCPTVYKVTPYNPSFFHSFSFHSFHSRNHSLVFLLLLPVLKLLRFLTLFLFIIIIIFVGQLVNLKSSFLSFYIYQQRKLI
ncbi:hypothetical protein C5167_018363 [Papaver somniferum]|uniref:Uncharacterized protein n=1 Tax=Papaver somniferum TaxID=3469 RepID=A0A4Y7IQD9_PAPSO|nr:hypothetical protein C5167_018363 [Papaver somniferum]